MEFVLDARGLLQDFEQLPVEPGLQRLVQDLEGRDPDAVYTTASYTKGAWFLRFLEQRVGREPLDAFLRGYFDHFAFRSINNDTFRAWLDEHLLSAHPDAVSTAEIDTWLHAPGIPDFAPQFESAAFARVDGERAAFLDGSREAAELPGADWNTHEWLYFLNGLPDSLAPERLQALDDAFALTETGNSEIAFAWYMIGINNGYPAIRRGLEQFLVEVGRRKFVVPLYRALADRESDRRWGRSIYQRARPGYHPITRASVDEIFSQTQP